MNLDDNGMKKLLSLQKEKRDFYTLQVVNSAHSKKIIVSGPGTGKTYLFGQILKQRSGKCLVLTFINNLADKLNNELGDKAKCCTFHSFCKNLLHRIKRKGIDDNFIFYPDLSLIIKSDARLLLNKDFNFHHSFTRLERTTPEFNFFIEHANYYNAVSFDDSVFRVLEHFQGNPSEIPVFEQILVDEYQDFNLLEVTFLDLMTTKNLLLIVGDDDQALYGQLKDASPQYIREKYQNKQYKIFELPFCSRCTKVIIAAIQNIILMAKSIKKLSYRVDKKYICYLPDKLEDSRKYPEIVHVHCSVQSEKSPYLSKFIEKEIRKLKKEEIKEFNKNADHTVLITGPHHYLKQINSYLIKSNQDWTIIYRKQDDTPRHTNMLEGYRILLNRDRFSNLGWRIILECDCLREMKKILREAINNNKRLFDYLPQSFVKKHERVMQLLEKLRNNTVIEDQDKKFLELNFRHTLDELRAYFQEVEKERIVEEKDVDRLSIILTTYVGSKGLSAGYVFAVGLNEGNLPKNNCSPTDIEICQFIVILARTVKKCYLLSVSRFAGKPAGSPSIFLYWISEKNKKEERVDKNFRF